MVTCAAISCESTCLLLYDKFTIRVSPHSVRLGCALAAAPPLAAALLARAARCCAPRVARRLPHSLLVHAPLHRRVRGDVQRKALVSAVTSVARFLAVVGLSTRTSRATPMTFLVIFTMAEVAYRAIAACAVAVARLL